MSLSWLSLCLSLCLYAGPLPEVSASAVVHAWDERRARAWADGDAGALADLYTERSTAGGSDVARLRAWTRRGLRVEGLRVQLLGIHVVSSRPGRLTVDLTDRVAGGVVRPAGVPLPRDTATRHRMVLRLVAGQWRVATVRDQARPERTTSSTVGSRNG